MGRECSGIILGTIDRKATRAAAKAMLDKIGLEIDVRVKVHELGVAQQQMVEIAKALSQDARILVMDEPTAALSEREIARLFTMVRKLKADGVAIVYISHRLGEVFELGDRITVLRDGRKVASMRPADTSPDDLVRKMVGRAVDTTYGRHFCTTAGETVLELDDVCAANGVVDVSLSVKAGEIVGLCGLVGSGRTEVARAIFGADRILSAWSRSVGKRAPAAATARPPRASPSSRRTARRRASRYFARSATIS